MSDHPNPGAVNDAAPMKTALDLEAARCTFAAARVRALEALELRLLDLAVQAADDGSANELELQADTAWRDGLAVSREHDPEKLYSSREEVG